MAAVANDVAAFGLAWPTRSAVTVIPRTPHRTAAIRTAAIRWVSLAIVAAVLAIAGVTSAPREVSASTPVGTPVIERRLLGYSVQHRPIYAYRLGTPTSRITAVIVGQMHGDEHAGVTVANSLVYSRQAVSGIDLWVVPTMNPDGNAANRRQNAHGVDLNRNWPDHWVRNPAACYTGPNPLIFASGCYSGTGPLSEPETTMMYAFLASVRPRYVVSLHQPLGGVDTTDGGALDPAFRRRLASRLGLAQTPFTCWSVCNGSMTGWFTDYRPGAAITVEFGFSPPSGYLTSTAPRGIVAAMGGSFVSIASRNPTLRLSRASAVGSSVTISGTATDPDTTKPVRVRLFDGRTLVASTLTNVRTRAFTFTRSATNGAHTYTVQALNYGAGTGSPTLSRAIRVDGAPRGNLDSVQVSDQSVVLAGWALDPDRTSASIGVVVYDGAALLGTYPATVSRPDVDAGLRVTGSHGFVITLADRTPGTHTYTVRAVNIGYAGANPVIRNGTVTVTVAAPPAPTQAPSSTAAPTAADTASATVSPPDPVSSSAAVAPSAATPS